MQALRKWKVDLLGSEFLVYTDYKMLLNLIGKRTCHDDNYIGWKSYPFITANLFM